MAALTQLHAQDRVTRLEQGEVHRHIGGAARVWLYVGVLGAEQLLGAVDGQLLDIVDERDALVVAGAWVAFGVFDVEMRRQALQDRGRGVVLAGDEVQRACVALTVGLHERPHVWIGGL